MWVENRSKGKVVKWVTVFWHYSKDYKLVFTSTTITPDRFFTIIGVIFGLLGLAVLGNHATTYTDALKSRIDFILVGITIVCTVGIAPFISFFLTRRDTEDFSKVLANRSPTNQLIKHLAFEAWRVVHLVNSKTENDRIRSILPKITNSLRTIDSLKAVLAERLMISPREACDDFLRFSSSIYMNRHVTRILCSEPPVDGHMKKYNQVKVGQILEYSFNIEHHLFTLLKTKIDLKKVEFMFQTRSISAITEHYIWILDTARNSLNGKDDFKLLFNLQKAHRNGVAAFRALGVELVSYLHYSDKHNTKRLDKLRDRMDAALGIQPERTNNLAGWFSETQDYIRHQENMLQQVFSDTFKKYVQKFNLHSNTKMDGNGNLYVVIPHFSRVIRTMVTKVIADIKNAELYDKVRIVILVDDDIEQRFSSRLMFHRIVYENENWINPHHAHDYTSIENRTWRSTPEALTSRLNSKIDKVVVLSSCDRIGKPSVNLEDHGDIAFSHQPMSMIEKLKKNEDQQIDVFIIAGNYKYDLDIIVNRFEPDSIVVQMFRDKLKKYRRSGMYQWETDKTKKIEVKIIANSLPGSS